jgi:hypothetical protein
MIISPVEEIEFILEIINNLPTGILSSPYLLFRLISKP